VILAVRVGQLAELVWVAVAAGLVVSLTFSLALLGAIRGDDARRGGQSGAAWLALSAAGLLTFLAVVVIAVILITTKT
jgi:hypothetical protein